MAYKVWPKPATNGNMILQILCARHCARSQEYKCEYSTYLTIKDPEVQCIDKQLHESVLSVLYSELGVCSLWVFLSTSPLFPPQHFYTFMICISQRN